MKRFFKFGIGCALLVVLILVVWSAIRPIHPLRDRRDGTVRALKHFALAVTNYRLQNQRIPGSLTDVGCSLREYTLYAKRENEGFLLVSDVQFTDPDKTRFIMACTQDLEIIRLPVNFAVEAERSGYLDSSSFYNHKRTENGTGPIK